MPSFRAIVLLASATVTALVSAAPTGLVSRAGLNLFSDSVDPVVKVNTLAASRIDSLISATVSEGGKVLPLNLSGRDEVQSLPAILAAGKEKLTTVSNELNATIAGQDEVDIDMITPFVTQCHDILAEIVSNVKLLIGHPDEAILGVTGTAQEVAELLAAILTLVTGILSCVLKVAGPPGAVATAVVKPLLQAIGALLLELIPTVLSLVQGVFVIIASVLNGVLNILSDLGLGGLVGLLSKI